MIRLVLFITVLNIEHFEVKNGRIKMADQKLNLNINWVKFSTWELVPDITDYKLEFIAQEIQTTDPIWRTNII